VGFFFNTSVVVFFSLIVMSFYKYDISLSRY
jgi:hypothetical protein